MFVNSKDENVYSLAVGGGIGAGSKGATGGLIVDLDVYHILIGYKLIKHGILLPKDHKQATENSFILAINIELKIMSSIGAGIGILKYKCTSGINGNCYDIDENTSQCIPLKLEFDYLFSPYIGIGISANNTFTDNFPLFSAMFHLEIWTVLE
ncbi:MAG: hypothetical protein IPL74_12455 [Bacteroidetes bacterium]|nr:hypothetical protein [Bacteroidota bacterium]